jgi:hypothetical protein
MRRGTRTLRRPDRSHTSTSTSGSTSTYHNPYPAIPPPPTLPNPPAPLLSALARLVTLLLKRHPRLLHEPVAPERADLDAAATPGAPSQTPSQSQSTPAATHAATVAPLPLPLYRQAVRLLRERRKAGSKLGARVYGQELKLAALVLSLLGEEASRDQRRRRRRRRGLWGQGEAVDGQYVRDEARLLLQACHAILGSEEQGGKAGEKAPVVAGAWVGGWFGTEGVWLSLVRWYICVCVFGD